MPSRSACLVQGNPFLVAILRVFCMKSKSIAAASHSHIKTTKFVLCSSAWLRVREKTNYPHILHAKPVDSPRTG